jgi:branched-chain amino acid transport system permease protein
VVNYIAGGLVYGALFAIAATGLVLTYKACRVFNFAHGAIAYAIATLYYQLTIEHGWDTGPALVVTLLIVAPLLGAALAVGVFRFLRRTAVSVQVVTTIGLFVAIPAVLRWRLGTDNHFDAVGLFKGPRRVYDIFGAHLNKDQVAMILAALVLAALLAALLRFTRFGLTVRAVVDSESLASLVGMNPFVVDAGAGAISAMMAGLAGVLMTPLLGLSEASFNVLLIASIAAAVVGGLRSIWWTFVGAIAIGLVQGLSAKYLPHTGIWARGFRPSLPFIVIFLVLAGYNLLLAVRHVPLVAAERGLVRHAARPGSRGYRWGASGLLVLGLLVVPWLVSGAWLGVVGSGVGLAIVLLSYVLITGEGEMVSLCQVTFAGIGAVATAQFATVHHWPAIPSLILAGVIAMPFGALISLASLRLGSLYLALATLGFAMLMDNLIFPINRFDQLSQGVFVDRPSIFGIRLATDMRFYFFALAVFAVAALLVANVRSSTSGKELAAMRSTEPAAAMLGVRIISLKTAVFTLSAFIAAVGGGVMAMASGVAIPGSFNAVLGLVWLATLVSIGVRRLSGALLAGLAYAVVPRLFSQYISTDWAEFPAVMFGLGAIMVAREPGGAIESTSDRLLGLGDKLRGRFGRGSSTAVSTAAGTAIPATVEEFADADGDVAASSH